MLITNYVISSQKISFTFVSSKSKFLYKVFQRYTSGGKKAGEALVKNVLPKELSASSSQPPVKHLSNVNAPDKLSVNTSTSEKQKAPFKEKFLDKVPQQNFNTQPLATQVQTFRPDLSGVNTPNENTEICAGFINPDFRKSDGSHMPSYEINHVIIYEKGTGVALGIFSSQNHTPQNATDPTKIQQAPGVTVSNTKLDGTTGPQNFVPFKHPRIFMPYDDQGEKEHGIIEIPEATKYLNIPEVRKRVLKSLETQTPQSVARVHKEDPSLYEENGIPTQPIAKNAQHNAAMSKVVDHLTQEKDLTD